jgi:hypothetical protein
LNFRDAELKSTNWKDIAELIGITAIVASLVFVGMQMKQSQQLAFAESVQLMRANGIEQGSLQAQHIGVWIRGNLGEELDDEDVEIYKILYTQVQNQWFFNWLALDSIGTGYEGVGPRSFAKFLHENPGARAEWTRTTAASGLLQTRAPGEFPAFAAEVQAALMRLESTSSEN